jgi:transposase-like protein
MAKKIRQPRVPQAAYTQEFRETAIKLAMAGNKTIGEVASELGLPPKKLYSWVGAWKKKHPQPAGNGKASTDDELRKLQKRYKELEMENEILKKAAAYFARTLL